jgi:thymidylate synthase
MRFEEHYLALMTDVIHYGQKRPDRTGVGTRLQFGPVLPADLSREFPILLTKPVAWKTAIKELLWMVSGSTNVKPLQEQGVHIWDAWADENGELGPVYGAQWRNADGAVFRNGVDQLANVIESLRKDPFSRRHVISSWNVGWLHQMYLPPCHYSYQFYVDYATDTQLRLNTFVHMRSADLPVGVPFNVVAYATLTLMLCRELDYAPGELRISMGDAHVYENQIDLALEQERRRWSYERLGARMSDDYRDRQTAKSAFGEQMQRDGLAYPLQGRGPKLIIKPSFKSVLTATIEDFDVIDYHPIEPRIDYPVAV